MKKCGLLIVVNICIFILGCSQKDEVNPIKEDFLYPVERNGKFGYVNAKGETIIEPIFDDAKEFEDKLAEVEINGKDGMIDEKGRFIIKPSYNWINILDGGLVVLEIEENYIGIWKEGKIKRVKERVSFINGKCSLGIICSFHHSDGKVESFIINEKGEKVSDKFGVLTYCEDSDLYIFLEEYNLKSSVKNKFGVLDSNLNVIFKPQYESIECPTEDVFLIMKDGFYGYLHINGNEITEPIFNYAEPFKDSLAACGIISSKTESRFGFINHRGKAAINFEFNFSESFNNGLAKVGVGYFDYLGVADFNFTPKPYEKSFNLKYGFIDRNGDYLIPPIYEEIYLPKGKFPSPILRKYQYSDSLIVLQKDRKFGALNKEGSIIIPFEYEELGDFIDGFAYYKLGEEFGLIDKQNNKILKMDSQFYYSGFDDNGVGRIKEEDKVIYIDRKGNVIF